MPWARTALTGVNLVVARDEMLGIIGPTGSGKSTLLQLMNGVLQPTEGQVLIDGQDPSRLRGREITRLRQKVGLVFQSPEDQLFENRVYDDIAFGPRNLGLGPVELDLRVRWAMELLELDFDTLHHRNPQTLSGGQKRRVAIAGILALQPEYLILDEPAAGLDPQGRRLLLKVIKNLHRMHGMGVVMVSHRLQDIFEICHRVAVLNDGRVICTGTPAEILRRAPELISIGMQMPPINQVLFGLKSMLPGIRLDLTGPEAAAREIDRVLKEQL